MKKLLKQKNLCNFKLNNKYIRNYLKIVSENLSFKGWKSQVKTNLIQELRSLLKETLRDYLQNISNFQSLDSLLKDYKATGNLQTNAYIVQEKKGKERVSKRWVHYSKTGEILEESPLPLLNTVDGFKLTKGPSDPLLDEYGIDVTDKNREERVLLWINREESNISVNKYLKREYAQLLRYREANDIEAYWTKYFWLILQSDAFFLANLSNWQELWYKEMDIMHLITLREQIKNYGQNQDLATEELRNVWIESPKGK